VSPEQHVPKDHPLRPVRVMTDGTLRDLNPRFNKLYAKDRAALDYSGEVAACVEDAAQSRAHPQSHREYPNSEVRLIPSATHPQD
jgi:hypothetical protein